MNVLRSVDTFKKETVEQEDESDGNSRLRDAQTMNKAPSGAADNSRVEYKVVHRVSGRLRLKAFGLRHNFSAVSASLSTLVDLDGIQAVRCVKYSASAVISYDATRLSEAAVLNAVSDLSVASASTPSSKGTLNTYPAPVPIRWLETLFGFIESIFSPALQLAIGLAAFIAPACRAPLMVSRILVLTSTAPIACRALRTLRNERKLGIDALDGVAASLMIANGKFIEAGFMTALISLGELIREQTTRRCEQLVTDLLGMSGRSAWLVKGDKRICIPADEVKVDDIVVVYPGDMVPVDGLVINGEASIDQSKLTGESIPVEVIAGSTVFASTVAVEGKVYVRCTATGSQTRAGLVLQCVSEAPLHETKIQNYASNLADKAVVPIFLAAGTSFLLTWDVRRLISMLVLDFCTGIRIAAPTAVLSSMHRAGRRGILIKSGAALERLSSVSAIIFDKTGTLTSGEPKIEEIARFNGRSEDDVLALAAAVEMRLHHPAARAIVKEAQRKGLRIAERDNSEFARGMGAQAWVEGQLVIVGSKRMMEAEGIEIDETRESELRARKLGESVSFVAVDGKVAGVIRYSDRLRPEVSEAIRQLKKLGLKKLVMATGDTEEAAQRIAATCGLDEVMAKAFPEDKAELVKRLKAQGHRVAVIGDGINDSPALAYADVAISLHGATDAAQQSADVVLTDDNIARLPEAIRIARSAMALVKQNLAVSVIPNATGFAMAATGMLEPARSDSAQQRIGDSRCYQQLAPTLCQRLV